MTEDLIRPASDADLSAVADIYAHYVRDTLITFDEEVPDPSAWSAKLAAAAESGWPFLVAERADGVVLGYALLQPFRDKSGWRFAAENSIYLAPEATGRGLGRALLHALIDTGRSADVRSIIAVISDQGTGASIALHEKAGFAPSGYLEQVGWKHGQRVGVHLMTLHLV